MKRADQLHIVSIQVESHDIDLRSLGTSSSQLSLCCTLLCYVPGGTSDTKCMLFFNCVQQVKGLKLILCLDHKNSWFLLQPILLLLRDRKKSNKIMMKNLNVVVLCCLFFSSYTTTGLSLRGK